MRALCRSLFLPLALGGAAWTADLPQTPAQEAPDQPCIKLNHKGQPDGGFQWKTREFCKRSQAGPIGVMFIGDSITAGWDKVPDLWQSISASAAITPNTCCGALNRACSHDTHHMWWS